MKIKERPQKALDCKVCPNRETQETLIKDVLITVAGKLDNRHSSRIPRNLKVIGSLLAAIGMPSSPPNQVVFGEGNVKLFYPTTSGP